MSSTGTHTHVILDVMEEFEQTRSLDLVLRRSFHGKYGEGFVPFANQKSERFS